MNDPRTARLVEYLTAHPGSSTTDIVDAVGLADGAAAWNLILAAEEAGQVRAERLHGDPRQRWAFYAESEAS